MFYAEYTVSVPVLISLTDRVEPKRIYIFGLAIIAFSTAGFVYLADGFYSACAFRAL
jgi:MFS family permease